MPAFLLPLVEGLFKASRQGEFAAVDPTLGQLLGRATTSMREVLEQSISRPQ